MFYAFASSLVRVGIPHLLRVFEDQLVLFVCAPHIVAPSGLRWASASLGSFFFLFF